MWMQKVSFVGKHNKHNNDLCKLITNKYVCFTLLNIDTRDSYYNKYLKYFLCYTSLGGHLYALSKPGSSHLRLVVAVGKRLVVLMWKHSSAWSAWCPVSENDVVEGFQYLRVNIKLRQGGPVLFGSFVPLVLAWNGVKLCGV